MIEGIAAAVVGVSERVAAVARAVVGLSEGIAASVRHCIRYFVQKEREKRSGFVPLRFCV